MNSNDNKAVCQRILESSDCVQHVKTLGPRKHGSQGNTRQGRRQVPKLVSPASFGHFHFSAFSVSYTAYQAYPASFASVFCSRQLITKFLMFLPSIHHEVLDHAELLLHIADLFFSYHSVHEILVSAFEQCQFSFQIQWLESSVTYEIFEF